jgi:hypothetical protein
MSPEEFLAAIHQLGFASPYAAAQAIGVSASQAQRYAQGADNGGSAIPEAVRLLLEAYLRHGLPQSWKEP